MNGKVCSLVNIICKRKKEKKKGSLLDIDRKLLISI